MADQPSVSGVCVREAQRPLKNSFSDNFEQKFPAHKSGYLSLPSHDALHPACDACSGADFMEI